MNISSNQLIWATAATSRRIQLPTRMDNIKAEGTLQCVSDVENKGTNSNNARKEACPVQSVSTTATILRLAEDTPPQKTNHQVQVQHSTTCTT